MSGLSRDDADSNGGGFEASLDGNSFANAGDLIVPDILKSLSEAVYATDAKGRITFFNRAAGEMWGASPELGTSEFGIWRLLRPDGAPLTEAESPIALALKHGEAVRGLEALGERADGSRIAFFAFCAPIMDRDGAIVGAANLLVDCAGRVTADHAVQRLAAIVESSDDAIIAKDTNGVITDWNLGAQRLFGYSAEEAIGRPVAMLIPQDRHDEEPGILARLRRGERIHCYETVRRRKDEGLVDISLSVSPIKNRAGRVVGASKIARDITTRRRAEEQQRLLLREMNHRIKNLFTLATSIVTLSARSAATPAQLASAVTDRLGALARAQDLTIPQILDTGEPVERQATLQALIETIVAPYQGGSAQQPRIQVHCCDFPIRTNAVTGFALLINEFSTNAAKYGALSIADGRVEIHCTEENDRFLVEWMEFGGPQLNVPLTADGFGSRLVKATVEGQLCGKISREWRPDGLAIHLEIPADRIRVSECPAC
jgi:PAS domain S-box-containing protein